MAARAVRRDLLSRPREQPPPRTNLFIIFDMQQNQLFKTSQRYNWKCAIDQNLFIVVVGNIFINELDYLIGSKDAVCKVLRVVAHFKKRCFLLALMQSKSKICEDIFLLKHTDNIGWSLRRCRKNFWCQILQTSFDFVKINIFRCFLVALLKKSIVNHTMKVKMVYTTIHLPYANVPKIRPYSVYNVSCAQSTWNIQTFILNFVEGF